MAQLKSFDFGCAVCHVCVKVVFQVCHFLQVDGNMFRLSEKKSTTFS